MDMCVVNETTVSVKLDNNGNLLPNIKNIFYASEVLYACESFKFW